MKGLFIFAAGVVAGAVAGAYLIKDKVMADAKQEIEEVREYYKSKKETKKEEEPVEEKQEETKLEDKKEYEEITRNYTNYNKPNEQPKKVVEDMPYVIDVEEFGELPEYDIATYTYFADGVLVDDVDDVIDDPDPIIGLENLKIFEEFPGCSAIYVRNDIWRMDFEVLKDDWNWSDMQEPEVEKKPHQL